MKKLLILVVAIVGLVVAGCGHTGEVKADLGQEFTLSIGQTAVVRGENLRITFLEVLEDSRCPKNVTCIWAGRVRCLVEITDKDGSQEVELTEPGLTDKSTGQIYQGYQLTFRVQPYPEAGREISAEEYRLLLTVSKIK